MCGRLEAKEKRIDERMRVTFRYAPVSSWHLVNIGTWSAGTTPGHPFCRLNRGVAEDGSSLHLTSPLSSHFVIFPIQIHCATPDFVTPPEWSRSPRERLGLTGKPLEYVDYPGERHRSSRPT